MSKYRVTLTAREIYTLDAESSEEALNKACEMADQDPFSLSEIDEYDVEELTIKL